MSISTSYYLAVTASVLVFLVSPLKSHASEKFEPAAFINVNVRFQENIKPPNSMLQAEGEFTYIIPCEAVISPTGKFITNFCHDDNGREEYTRAIHAAAEYSAIKPALINGRGRTVYFQYFVAFTKKGKHILIEALQNSGLQLKQYGPDYTSPQRYIKWPTKFGSVCTTGFKRLVTVHAVISSEGRANSVSVEGDKVTDKCKQSLIKSYTETRFIPAFHNGAAVEARYTDRLFDLVGPAPGYQVPQCCNLRGDEDIRVRF